MSTAPIRKALEALRREYEADHHGMSADEAACLDEALAAVEALERACLTLYRLGVVHNELGEEHETTKELDDAVDHLMSIGLEKVP